MLRQIFDLKRMLIRELQRTPVVQRHFIHIRLMHQAISKRSSLLADNIHAKDLNRSVLGRSLTVMVPISLGSVVKNCF